ncbi:ABC transporter substrate-binding protein [Acidisoma cellulosilytica]|uniref:ABC transporter substrate-binding protein n=1 Tax=Acidisoma cellulosilyticum TaxID=2802395 RepID=A0A963YZ53_9PROT|nr:ABC transporter substrate-binding protein [Acidisoma cellulosilyticum]MCB8879877.1 ABC transporter substrate-binding protein [Acidisoma cellulosilyticum]
MRHLLALALLIGLPLGTAAAATPALPPAIAAKGSLTVAIIPNYPPMEFRDPATNALEGFDVDLGEALGKKLGLKIDWQETSFDQMLPSLTTGRVDAVLSGMGDLATRHAVAHFVDYLRSGPQFFVLTANAAKYPTIDAVCGKHVGASSRTSFPKEIAAWSVAHCGSTPVMFVGTNGSADARTQLKEGRIDVAVQGGETLPYIMKQEPGAYALVGTPILYQFTGLAVAHDDLTLGTAIAGALGAMIADGSYQALTAKWGLGPDGVDKVTIDAGQ